VAEHYVIIGVKAIDHIRVVTRQCKEPILVHGKPSFDEHGNPLVSERNFHYTEFLPTNKRFYEYQPSPILEPLLKELNIELGCINEYLEETYELTWRSYDYNTVYKDDIIGLVIFNGDKNKEGIAQENLPALFTKAKDLLEKAGIVGKPKLYSITYYPC
jgi:hypothetical protein